MTSIVNLSSVTLALWKNTYESTFAHIERPGWISSWISANSGWRLITNPGFSAGPIHPFTRLESTVTFGFDRSSLADGVPRFRIESER